MTATFPLLTSEPSANFKLQIPSPIYFGKNFFNFSKNFQNYSKILIENSIGTTSVDTTDLLFSLQISNSPSASLDFDIHFNTLSSQSTGFQ